MATVELKAIAERAFEAMRSHGFDSTELGDFEETLLHNTVARLLDDARAAPPDDANAVSADQRVTLVAGNMARMLLDVAAVSRERIDSGVRCLPWLQVSDMHFS